MFRRFGTLFYIFIERLVHTTYENGTTWRKFEIKKTKICFHYKKNFKKYLQIVVLREKITHMNFLNISLMPQLIEEKWCAVFYYAICLHVFKTSHGASKTYRCKIIRWTDAGTYPDHRVSQVPVPSNSSFGSILRINSSFHN